jgi:hypothetical protein
MRETTAGSNIPSSCDIPNAIEATTDRPTRRPEVGDAVRRMRAPGFSLGVDTVFARAGEIFPR